MEFVCNRHVILVVGCGVRKIEKINGEKKKLKKNPHWWAISFNG